MTNNELTVDPQLIKKWSIRGAVILLLIAATVAMLWPVYRVWEKEMYGKAELAEAEWNRKIVIEEAMARETSAKHDADAEIERARGIAEANKTIAASLEGKDEYLRYLWLQGLKRGDVIYVPTEAGIPLMEAGRGLKPPAVKVDVVPEEPMIGVE